MRESPAVRLSPFLLALPVLAISSCTPPRRDFKEEDQVKAVTGMRDLMWFQAAVTDPCFSLARNKDATKLTEEDYALFRDMARRLPWAAKRLPETSFSRGPEFDRLAGEMVTKAAAVETLVSDRDGKGAMGAVLDVESTCRSCHKAFR